MNLNIDIQSINNNHDDIPHSLSPLSTHPSSPISNNTPSTNILNVDINIDTNKTSKKTIRKGSKNIDDTLVISYKYFKKYVYTSLSISKKSKNKPFFYKKQLQLSLDQLKIKYNRGDKKEVLQEILYNHYLSILKYDTPKTIYQINILKHSISQYIKQKKNKIYGPGFSNKSVCKNTEDCFTLEQIEDIPDIYFFSIKDNYGSVFFFDIRTFKKLVDSKSNNPYNREPFTDDVIELYKLRCEFMEKNNISMIFPEDEEYLKNLTPEDKIKNKLLDIFYEIDRLNVIAGGTRLEWFNTLNIIQLKKLYRVLEDIWNYQAELSNAKKLEIVPQNNMFPNTVNYVFALTNKIHIQNIILNEMEKLVKGSPIEAHRHTGAYYVLISLTEISYQCAQDLPWLIQY